MNRGPSPAVRATVWEREGGCCAWCGHPIHGYDYSLQHRRARGMGGSRRADTNAVTNLILLHGSATTGCHGRAESHPAEAEALGYRVHSALDPAAVPVFVRGVGRVLLTADGGYQATETERIHSPRGTL